MMRNEKDIFAQPYDLKNENHKNYISEHLKKFNDSSAALGTVDNLIVLPSGLTCAVLSLVGYLPLYFSLILFTGLMYGSQKLVNRDKPANEFQENLHSLIKIYLWCCEKGPIVTNDESFLNILKAISPYVNSQNESENILIPWKNINANDLSEVYIKTLAQSPHRIKFLNLNQESKPKVELKVNAALPKQKSYKEKFYSFFHQSTSEAKQAIYGYEAKESIPEIKAPANTNFQIGPLSIPKFW